MNQRKTALYSAIVILMFLLANYGRPTVFGWFGISSSTYVGGTALFYSWWLLIVVMTTGALFGFGKLFDSLGLNRPIGPALLFALAAVSPMLISSAIMGQVATPVNAFRLFHTTILAGGMEELFYRSFLFGLLFTRLRWGFVPASLLGAVIFGMGHLYQGSSAAETAGVFLVTAIGAVWFAWLYAEWRNSFWVPAFLHILMNFSWIFFKVSGTALGGGLSNVFRVAVIAISIVYTVRRSRKEGGLQIGGRNLWVGKTEV